MGTLNNNASKNTYQDIPVFDFSFYSATIEERNNKLPPAISNNQVLNKL